MKTVTRWKREEGGTLTVSFIVWLLKIRLHLISMEQSTLIDCDLRSDIELTYFCWCKFELDCHWTYMFLLMFSFHENCNKIDDSIFIQFCHKFEMHRGFYSISGCLAKQIVLNNDTTTILSILLLLYLYIEYIFIKKRNLLKTLSVPLSSELSLGT